MNRKTIITLLACMTLMSCGQLNPEKLSGTVLDDSTHLCVSDAEVGLWDFHDWSVSNLILLKSITTGSDGKFLIEYNLKRDKPYAIIVRKTGYENCFYRFKKGAPITGLILYLKK